MQLTYQVVKITSDKFAVHLFLPQGLKIFDRNPETNKPFYDEKSARRFAETFLRSLEYTLELNKIQNIQVPTLKVSFRDYRNNLPVSVVKVNQPVKVFVELCYTLDKQKIRAPIDGIYVVPYFFKGTNRPLGATIIEIKDGQGESVIRPEKVGIYEVVLDKILNGYTMQKPNPLPELSANPTLFVT